MAERREGLEFLPTGKRDHRERQGLEQAFADAFAAQEQIISSIQKDIPVRETVVQMTTDELNDLLEKKATAVKNEVAAEMARVERKLHNQMQQLIKNSLKEAPARGDTNELQRLNGLPGNSTTTLSVFDSEIDIDEYIEARQKGELGKLLDGEKALPERQEEDKDEEWHTPFGESIYTLLYLCEPNCLGFWYSVFIYTVQVATISLTLVDIIDPGSDNPIRLPPMVSLTVTIAQGVTIFLVLAYMSDLIEALLKLQDGFYPEILEDHPGATFATWLVSCLCQAGSGLLLLITVFVLTMQVDSVISIMLNFAALHFMSDIDDLAFAMAKMGFVSDRLRRQAEAVVDFNVPKRKRRTIYRRFFYTLAMLALFVGYAILKNQQLNGKYLQTHIFCQFGDGYNDAIPYYSGILSTKTTRTSGFRQYYDSTENILLAYCHKNKTWTFSFSQTNDPCDGFATSLPTATYDVTTISNQEWKVLDANGRFHPFDSFALVGRHCDSSCKGTCGTDELCHCRHDQFGLDCEFSNVCPHLVLDGRTPEMPRTTYYRYGESKLFYAGSDYQLLRNNSTQQYVKSYNMPVYYSDKQYPASIMFFSGQRWVIVSETTFLNYSEVFERYPNQRFFPELSAQKFGDQFHAHHNATYTPVFLSDPVVFETPDFNPTPAGLGWWSVGVLNVSSRSFVIDSAIETSLSCKTCSGSDGFCGIGGSCNETTGECVCESLYYYGDKCELELPCYLQDWPCSGHGVCDQVSGDCRCNDPYFGRRCNTIHRCIDKNGECHNGGVCNTTSGFCECPDDHSIEGRACENIADCNVFGCSNGGICTPNGKCICRPPFTGVLCDYTHSTQIEMFCEADKDCTNGICDNTTKTCICDNPASFGSLCEQEYNCAWGGCLNSGVCNESSGICECSQPFFGPDCGKEPLCVDDSYCEEWYGEGSVCKTDWGKCECDAWYAGGKTCIWDCAFKDCHNGGYCNAYGVCECPFPYAGLFCDHMFYPHWDPFYYEFQKECVEENGFPPYNLTVNGTVDCTIQY